MLFCLWSYPARCKHRTEARAILDGSAATGDALYITGIDNLMQRGVSERKFGASRMSHPVGRSFLGSTPLFWGNRRAWSTARELVPFCDARVARTDHVDEPSAHELYVQFRSVYFE
jgi:hypothetical protein